MRRRVVPQKGFKLGFIPHPRLFQRCRITASKEQPQKVCKIVCQRMNEIRSRVHGADGKYHTAEASNKAEVNAIHASPAKNRCTFGRAKVRVVIFTTLHSYDREFNTTSQKFLKYFIHRPYAPIKLWSKANRASLISKTL